jgi:phosphopantothenoylcysteine decarboxylase/phosphopantothenate--cysteine ligase
LAPAMNVRMWEHKSTKDNLKKLKKFGYKIIGPVIGDMACGEFGEGKMSDPSEILHEINIFLSNQIKNKKIKALVTAGPTNEYIDPVRFITNKSSGKQGYEIAKSLSKRGFDTTLISGPTNLNIDENINLIKVETAEEMFKATQKNLPTDIAIFSAAVADFKVKEKNKYKIKRQEKITINFEKNIDILNYVSNHNSMRPKLVVGFAAETNNLDKNAIAKLTNKNCDWIIANDISKKNSGFDSDYNEVTIHYKNSMNKKEKLSFKKKSEISEEIVDRIIAQIN